MNNLIERLIDEADQCRNDGANDIAALLDEAATELRKHCDHVWTVTHQGVLFMDCKCSKCGSTKRESWD